MSSREHRSHAARSAARSLIGRAHAAMASPAALSPLLRALAPLHRSLPPETRKPPPRGRLTAPNAARTAWAVLATRAALLVTTWLRCSPDQRSGCAPSLGLRVRANGATQNQTGTEKAGTDDGEHAELESREGQLAAGVSRRGGRTGADAGRFAAVTAGRSLRDSRESAIGVTGGSLSEGRGRHQSQSRGNHRRKNEKSLSQCFKSPWMRVTPSPLQRTLPSRRCKACTSLPLDGPIFLHGIYFLALFDALFELSEHWIARIQRARQSQLSRARAEVSFAG
jgi:hypothetical protein